MLQLFYTKNKKLTQLATGFTLIELLVVVVIMSLITLAFLNRQNKFDSSTIMRSLAYSLALSVRQAQVYGISVRPTTATGGTFSSAHGLHFVLSSGGPSTYVLFADVDRNNKFSNSSDLVDQLFTLNSGFSISEICAVSSNAKRCSSNTNIGGVSDDSSGSPTITTMDLIFVRPNPDAKIYAYDSSDNPITFAGSPEVFSSAYIQISSQNGDKRFVTVTNTGQVSVCGLNVPINSSGC